MENNKNNNVIPVHFPNLTKKKKGIILLHNNNNNKNGLHFVVS